MELKILKNHNYGNILNSDKNDDYYHKFYFSFFKLNNGSLISLMKVENFKTKKLIHTEFEYNYANDYEMGEDFLTYWQRSFKINYNKIGQPSIVEKKLIENFIKTEL